MNGISHDDPIARYLYKFSFGSIMGTFSNTKKSLTGHDLGKKIKSPFWTRQQETIMLIIIQIKLFHV